ncbi:MAG: M48 family metalloprotease [Bdellovibrionales bacterium]|nr:M48 family metalloprotease [Bdellovibrionales bacterium]
MKRCKFSFSRVLLSIPAAAFLLCACSNSRNPIPEGVIPDYAAVTPEQETFGHELLGQLTDKFELDFDDQRLNEVEKIVGEITKAAGADQEPWHIHLFKAPQVVDVRAVHGNHLFVWSGFLDAVEDRNERAAVISHELAHTLAHHNEPAEFSLLSEIMLQTFSMAAAVAVSYASQGMVVINAPDAAKWAYVQAAGLDPIDRDYPDDMEKEASAISLLLMSQAGYQPEAALDLWSRAAANSDFEDLLDEISRDLSADERADLIKGMLKKLPTWTAKLDRQALERGDDSFDLSKGSKANSNDDDSPPTQDN